MSAALSRRIQAAIAHAGATLGALRDAEGEAHVNPEGAAVFEHVARAERHVGPLQSAIAALASPRSAAPEGGE